MADVDGGAVQAHFAGRASCPPEQASHEFAAARADETIEADDLAAADRERDIAEAGARQPRDVEQHVTVRNRFLVVNFLDGARHHVPDQGAFIGLGHDMGRDELAVPEHGDAVRELEDFFQAVADIDDGDTLGIEPPDEGEELFGILSREIGGWLIKNEELDASFRGAGGRHQLLLADGEIGEHSPGRQIEAKIGKHALGIGDHFAVTQQAVMRSLITEEDVGGNGQMRAEHDFLMHRIDAEADRLMRRGKGNIMSLPEDFAAAAGMRSRQDLDEG